MRIAKAELLVLINEINDSGAEHILALLHERPLDVPIFLYLPINDYRPEEIRVVRIHGAFIVQLRRPVNTGVMQRSSDFKWITQVERNHLEDAIYDAVNWYRKPS